MPVAVKDPPPLDPSRLKKEPLVLPKTSTLGPALHIHAQVVPTHFGSRKVGYEVHDEHSVDMFPADSGADPDSMMWYNESLRRSILEKDQPRDPELKPVVVAELNSDRERVSGPWNLKRKATDHLGRRLYPGGVKRENYEDTAPGVAKANVEKAAAKYRLRRPTHLGVDASGENEVLEDDDGEKEDEDPKAQDGEEDAGVYASESEYDFFDSLVDLPADFKPANPPLGKRMKAITPELPTHLELESDFVDHMIRFAGASRTQVRKSARDLEANDEFKAAWQTYCDSIRTSPSSSRDLPDEKHDPETEDPTEHLMALLNLIIVNATETFPPMGKMKCQDIVFSRNDEHGAPTWTGNKPPYYSGVLKRGTEEGAHLCNTVLVIDATSVSLTFSFDGHVLTVGISYL